MNRSHDTLPQTPAISALVRRIVFRLNGELHFHGHKPLTDLERSGLFDLAEASRILDGVAILPNMAQHENRARRDLLDLYDVFDHTLPSNAPALNEQERAAIEEATRQGLITTTVFQPHEIACVGGSDGVKP